MAYLAPGVRLLDRWLPASAGRRELLYKLLAFAVTWLTYVAYHIAKRPIAVMETSITFLQVVDDYIRALGLVIINSWIT